MKPILLWIKKDLKEMKWYWTVWFLFLIFKGYSLYRLHSMGGVAVDYFDSNHNIMGQFYRMLCPILNGITWVLEVILIGGLVVQDPIQGTRSFWMTRPFSKGEWLCTKMIIIIAAIVLPILIIDLIPCYISGFSVKWLFEIFTWELLSLMTTVMMIGIVGLCCEKRGGFYGLFAILGMGWILWTVGPLFLNILIPKKWAGTSKFLGELFYSDYMPKKMSDYETYNLLIMIVSLVGVVAVLLSYLRSRNRWLHIALFLMMIGVIPKLISYGVVKNKFNFFTTSEKEYVEKLELNDPKIEVLIKAKLDSENSKLSNIKFIFNHKPSETPGWIRPLQYKTKTNNKKVLSSFNSLEKERRSENHPIYSDTLEITLGKSKILNPRKPQAAEYHGIYLNNNEEIKEMIKNHSPLQFKGAYELCEYRPSLELDHKKGTRSSSHNVPLEVVDSCYKTGMGIVVVRETEWTSPFRPELSTPAPTFGAALMVGEATPKFVYCLYHEKNKEIYLPKENERYQKPIGNNYSNRLCSKMNALIFVGIDEDWMKEAKLVALETVPIGRGKFQYEIPNDQILPLILSQTDQNKE